MTPNRNAPCPCGSGRKYKHCHGKPSPAAAQSDDATWRRIRSATDGFPSLMLRFVRQTYGPEVIHEAWAEFTLWDPQEDGFDPDSYHVPVFMSWFFHRWAPDPLDTEVADTALHERAPTAVLLERRGRRLDPTLRRYLEACLTPPFSFHEILSVEPGRGFRSRDVFSGRERDVLESSASRTLRRGDLFFGQLVTSEGITLLEACSSVAIPPAEKLALIDLRERMAGEGGLLDDEDIGEEDLEVRELYLDIVETVMHPRTPALQNTDGEETIFHTLSFQIPSAQEGFDALKHLALDEPEEELLHSAQRDANGTLQRVSFPWKVAGNRVHTTWDNTMLGQLEIEGTRLVANVNSAERAARLRALVEAACPGARHLATEVETVEAAMAAHRVQGASLESPDPEELPPEAAEMVREMMSAHYQGWVDEPLPALGDLTPSQAVRTAAGREKVQALVDQMERDGVHMSPPLDGAIVEELRHRLGLKERN